MNNIDRIIEQLIALDFTREEAVLYLELLREPSTHLRLSQVTGINRTKVYRLAEALEKRSIVARRIDDRGTFLVANNPDALEIGIVNQEQQAAYQRQVLGDILPKLASLDTNRQENKFLLQSYEGEEGFKQMLWHELRAQGEILYIGDGLLEDLVQSRNWTERYRGMVCDKDIKVRALLPSNPGDFTGNYLYKTKHTYRRFIGPDKLAISNQMAIYNDVTATYAFESGKKVGFEIVSAAQSRMMRQIFEHYWEIADKN